MMSTQTDTISNLVIPYGLTQEEANIYLFLVQNGFSGALDISKKLHVGRTKVYRIIDKLKAKQLVEQQLDSRGLKFGATTPDKFEQLLIEKEQELSSLRKSLPSVISNIKNLLPPLHRESKVLYYDGIEGLKQVSYNITRAKGELRVFEMEHLSDFLDKDFSETVRQGLVENKIITKDLTNKSSFPAYTQVTKLIEHYSETRYIDPKLLTINFEVLIYNDVYATYTYKDNSVFCVEIYNDHLAAMQKQLFDFIWNQATPMKYIDSHGSAEVL